MYLDFEKNMPGKGINFIVCHGRKIVQLRHCSYRLWPFISSTQLFWAEKLLPFAKKFPGNSLKLTLQLEFFLTNRKLSIITDVLSLI